MRFLCDEMLHRLARWLRAAGYDTTLARGGAPDRIILDMALAEGRLLLTRDRGLAERRNAAGTVVMIEGGALPDQAASLSRQVPIDWRLDPMSRCLVCNQPLRSATAAERTTIPPQIRARGLPVTVCPQCRKLFWPGGHEQRMQQVLVRFDRTFSRHRTPGDPAAGPAAGP